MSYETWKDDYNGDESVVGSTFWMNTKAVTMIGVAPEGFFGDRMSSTPPDFYLPIERCPMMQRKESCVTRSRNGWTSLGG